MDGRLDIWDEQTNGRMIVWKDERMIGWKDGWMDRWNEWINGLMDP